MEKRVVSVVERIADWWRVKKARRAARKYSLDFEHRCVFDHQLRDYGYLKSGGICHVPMQSGKVGLYKATITKHWSGGTGQKDWHFEFQGYKEKEA